jgi:hypothetical protein
MTTRRGTRAPAPPRHGRRAPCALIALACLAPAGCATMAGPAKFKVPTPHADQGETATERQARFDDLSHGNKNLKRLMIY